MKDHPLIESLQSVQRDLTSIKARVAEIQRQVATLSLGSTKVHPCPHCQIPFPSALKRDEHVYRVHDGPTPPHWYADSTEIDLLPSDMQRADTVVPAPGAPTAKGRSA